MKLKEQCIQDSQDIRRLQHRLHKNLLLLSDLKLTTAYDKIYKAKDPNLDIYWTLEVRGLTPDEVEEVADRLIDNGIFNYNDK